MQDLRTYGLVIVLAFTLLTAACSGDGDEPNAVANTENSPAGSDDSADSSDSAQPTSQPTATPEPTPTPQPRPTPSIPWSELPPIDVPADLVPEDYDGRFVSYSTVLDLGDGPTLCTPAVAATSPPYCEGAPIDGWSWDAVDHDEQAGSRWGQYALIGRWDGSTFTLTEPAFPVDWSEVRMPEPEPIDVPCPEPEGGWWSDLADPQRLGPDHYNDAIDVLNTRSELLSIDIIQPIGPTPDGVPDGPDADGWEPGILVVRMTAVRDGDEEAMRNYWGGPLCLTVDAGLSTSQLNEVASQVIEIREELFTTPIMGAGANEGEVQVGMWVATEEAQARVDERFGPGVVRLMGLLWAID